MDCIHALSDVPEQIQEFNLYHNRFKILFLQLLKTYTEKMNKVFINKLQ